MFRIEITHDIDHLGVKDHYLDLVLPKFLLLTVIALLKGNMSFAESLTVVKEVLSSLVFPSYDSWDCVDEWLDLEATHHVRSTWFVACTKGKGISYSTSRASDVVNRLRSHSHVMGLHSQARRDVDRLPAEVALFKKVYGDQDGLPVRMHYLSTGVPLAEPHRRLIAYDSSVYDEDRFAKNDEFQRPINIMDTMFLSPLKQNLSLSAAQQRTRKILATAEAEQAMVVIDLHQRSLSRCFPRYREYILWLYPQIASRQSDNESP